MCASSTQFQFFQITLRVNSEGTSPSIISSCTISRSLLNPVSKSLCVLSGRISIQDIDAFESSIQEIFSQFFQSHGNSPSKWPEFHKEDMQRLDLALQDGYAERQIALLKEFPNIRTLTLSDKQASYENGVTDVFLFEICRLVPGLKELDLRNCRYITPKGILDFQRSYLGSIKSLKLPVNSEAFFQLLFGEDDPDCIKKTLKILYKTSLPMLLFRKKEIEELGYKIKAHPLRFLYHIYSEPKLVKYMEGILGDYFGKGTLFASNFATEIQKEIDKDNIFTHLGTFSHLLNADADLVEGYFREMKVKELLGYLVNTKKTLA